MLFIAATFYLLGENLTMKKYDNLSLSFTKIYDIALHLYRNNPEIYNDIAGDSSKIKFRR